MKMDINYYFEDIKKEEIFGKTTENRENVLEIFEEALKIIEEINEKENKELYTENIQEDVKINGSVYIGSGTEIEKGVIIQGPVYIGKNCKIMYNSYIRPGTIIGDNCVIGFSTEIKHTIMRDGSKVSDLAFVGDSIIGKNSRVGSGVIAANRSFNQSNVIIKDENKNKIDLKRESIGVILGDNSRIGSNCTTSPGTFIGKFTWIYPHTCVNGFIPEQKKVYDKRDLVFLENEKKVLYKSTDWKYDNYS